MTVEEEVKLTFIIGGTIYAMQELMEDGKYTKHEITEYTAKVIESISNI